MEELRLFAVAVGSHWAAWGAAAAIVLLVVTRQRTPKLIFSLLFTAGLFFACFHAWQDQYHENETGRTAGTLALENVGIYFKLPTPSVENSMQVELVLRNLYGRLVEYHLDMFDGDVASHQLSAKGDNLSGYVYPGTSTALRAPVIDGVDNSKGVIPVTFMYRISYQAVGSRTIHHSSKRIALQYHTETRQASWDTLNQHED